VPALLHLKSRHAIEAGTFSIELVAV